jgi:hypothetical protein
MGSDRRMEKLHNVERHHLYFSLNIVRIKSRRVEWAGHVPCLENRD